MVKRIIVAAAVGCLIPHIVIAQEKNAPSRRVMVIQEDVKVKSRSGVKVPVGLGQVLAITKENEDWVWVPRLKGWAPKEDTIDLDDAVAYFSAAIKEKPTSQAYHHRALAWAALKQYEKAIRDYNSAIGIKPSANLHINRGNAYRDSQRESQAIIDYNQALQLEPRNVIALNNRGLIFSADGKLDQALLDFNAALRIRSNYAEALNHRGVIHWKKGKLGQAERDYQKSIQQNRGYAEPYLNLGALEKTRSNYEQAVKYYEKALALEPNFVAANNDLGWILATCPQSSVRDPKRAIQYATRACQITKLKDANTLDTLAAALAATGKFDDAVKRIEQAIRLSNEESKEQMTIRKNLYVAKQGYVDRN